MYFFNDINLIEFYFIGKYGQGFVRSAGNCRDILAHNIFKFCIDYFWEYKIQTFFNQLGSGIDYSFSDELRDQAVMNVSPI